MIAGYEPRRLAGLDHHTRWALARLDRLTSNDEDAIGAIAAIGRLRTVLADDIAPAVAGILATDPLAPGRTFYDDWLRLQLDRRARTRFFDHDDIDLVSLLHVELTRQMEENGVPDLDDPFWDGEFLEWVAEFERRTRTDPTFATFLVQEAGRNPLLGYIVAAGEFGGGILLAITNTLMDSSPNGVLYDTYRDDAIQALVTTIANQPAIALTLLGTTDMTERMLTWNEREGGAFGLDGAVIGTLFSSALRHPFDEPERRSEARDILQQLVDLTHTTFDRGLPRGTAPGITTGLIGHLPSLLESLGLDGSVFFTNSHGRFETLLGSAASVVDLFGALLRDSSSRALLLATIPGLAVGAGNGLYELDSVNNYVITLAEAAETEQIEEEIRTARTRADWYSAISVVSKSLETALAVGGKQLTLARDVAHLVDSGARWLVDRVAVDELEMDDVHIIAFLLLTYGVSIAFLGRRRDDADDDPIVAEATGLTDEIQRLLDDGGSAEEVERQIRNLRVLVEEIGGDDAVATLDDLRLAPGRYDAAEDAELAD